MPRKNIIIIIGVVLFCFLVVVVLYAVSDPPFSYRQDFTRIHKLDAIKQLGALDLQSSSYYIAGATQNQIFFGNEKDSLELLVTDMSLGRLRHLRLSIVDESRVSLKNSRIEVDSPYFYIKAGDLPGIFKGNLQQLQAKRILEHTPYFRSAVSLSKKTFALLAMGGEAGSKEAQNILTTVSSDTLHKKNAFIPRGQVDSYISAMGMLRYSKGSSRLIYTYFYRNRYIVMDTSMNLLYEGNTLDTISRAQIKPVEVKKNFFTLASTPAIVNNNSQVYRNRLFIHSNLMANNETREVFDKVSVIDVYDIVQDRYLFSFYLPDYNSTKIILFKICGNKIVALYDHHVLTYALNDDSYEKDT